MTTNTQLPTFARDLLASCPSAGAGVHLWLFRTARVLHAFYPDKRELAAVLAAASVGCGRAVEQKEIDDAVENSRSCAWQPGKPRVTAGTDPVGKWPPRNFELIEAVVSEGPGLADLWELSPVRFEDNLPQTQLLIDALFPGNPLLCVGKTKSEFATKVREEWRGSLASHALIVPSPMISVWGQTKKNRQSQHALSSTGCRRYLVAEFDFKEKDAQGNDMPEAPLIRSARRHRFDVFDICAALLFHLGTKAPLTLAVHSGNKSIHGWFYCQGQPEERLFRFFRYAVSLGADFATWSRAQFVRLPDGLRENGNRQSAFFFNPSTIEP